MRQSLVTLGEWLQLKMVEVATGTRRGDGLRGVGRKVRQAKPPTPNRTAKIPLSPPRYLLAPPL